MTTHYTLPDGRHTSSYECWKAAHAEHAAVQAAFQERFGAHMANPESRRAAIEAMRAGALVNSGSVTVAPGSAETQAVRKEAEMGQRVNVAMTGTIHRNGSVGFAVPSASEPAMADADGLPPGTVRVSFFGGMPKKD